jgi:hypothetical protein
MRKGESSCANLRFNVVTLLKRLILHSRIRETLETDTASSESDPEVAHFFARDRIFKKMYSGSHLQPDSQRLHWIGELVSVLSSEFRSCVRRFNTIRQNPDCCPFWSRKVPSHVTEFRRTRSDRNRCSRQRALSPTNWSYLGNILRLSVKKCQSCPNLYAGAHWRLAELTQRNSIGMLAKAASFVPRCRKLTAGHCCFRLSTEFSLI